MPTASTSPRGAKRRPPAWSHAPLQFVDATHVRLGRRTLLYFAGSNYLGLGRHPRVLSAMQAALASGMTQPGASRATTGGHSSYDQAERGLARFFRQPAAAMVACGYLAPIAAVHTLRSAATHLLLDDKAHACVRDAGAVSALPLLPFAHSNPASLREALRQLPRSARPLVLTDGAFGTRGGMTPLDEYLAVLPSRGWLLVDDAHGAGAVGPGGRGAAACFGLRDPRIIQTISLAKAFGVGGGAVLGPVDWIESLRTSAPAFVGSTSMPITIPEGILAALQIMRAEPGRVRRLQANTRLLHQLLPAHPTLINHPATPVTAILPATPAHAETIRHALLQTGIYPPLINYLGSPATGFFRLALSSEHSATHIKTLAAAITTGIRESDAL